MKDLVVGDPLVEDHLFITGATIRKTKRGKPFVSFSCLDAHGREVKDCKIWGTDQVPQGVIKVMGRVDEYQENKHYVIDSWEESSVLNPSDFAKQNPLVKGDDPAKAEEGIHGEWTQCLNLIHNESIRGWITRFIEFWEGHIFPSVEPIKERHKRNFLTHPAAQTVHHDYTHGLVEHTCEVMRLAESMCKVGRLEDRDIDVCLAGAAIHDIGKLAELEMCEGVAQYSLEAKYYGWSANSHLYIGSHMLMMTQMGSMGSSIGDLPPHEFKILMNTVLSHHGEHADVKPNTIPAQIVHMADVTSTRLNMVRCGLVDNKEFEMPVFKGHGQNFMRT